MTIYKPRYFKAEELVSKKVYTEFKDTYKNVFTLFDDRLLQDLDKLRERYGAIVINNWKRGGKLEYCGYREPDCRIGATYSQHRFGRAVDLHFAGLVIEEVRQDLIKTIVNNPEMWYIRGIELDTPTWLHIDVRNEDSLFTFHP